VHVVGTGNIRLCTEAAHSDLIIRNIISTDNGIVELKAGRRIISDFDLSGFLIRHDTVVDSSLQLTRSLFENLAEAYAIPDYSVDDDLDLAYLNSANKAIWGEHGRPRTASLTGPNPTLRFHHNLRITRIDANVWLAAPVRRPARSRRRCGSGPPKNQSAIAALRRKCRTTDP